MVQKVNSQAPVKYFYAYSIGIYINNRDWSPEVATKVFPPCFRCWVIMPAGKKKITREGEYSLRIWYSTNGHDLSQPRVWVPVLADLGPSCQDCCSSRWHPGTACSATARALERARGKRAVRERSLLGLRNLFLVCRNRLPGRRHRTCYPQVITQGEPCFKKARRQKAQRR